MDNIVDSLHNSYLDFLTASTEILESRATSNTLTKASTESALDNFKQKYELLRVSCDQAEEYVESLKQRIGSECLVDEATGSVAERDGHENGVSGLPPISAVRLEQMSKAVRWLVLELQHGPGASSAASHPTSSATFDGRFSEDPPQ